MTTLATSYARPEAATCCVPGCNAPRHPISAKRRSRFCETHYHQRDARLRSCSQPKDVSTDTALATLHQLRPPKPVREYPGTSLKWGVDMTEHAMKCKVWHREADELIARRGGRLRPLVALDDMTHAAALARLAELTSGGERGAA